MLLPEVEVQLERASVALEAAKSLAAGGFSADAASRAYYAMFHAATALTVFRGLEIRAHGGLSHLLGTTLTENGDVPRPHLKAFRKAMEMRGLSDYDAGFRPSAMDLTQLIESADQFLQYMQNRIRSGQG